MLKTYKDLNVWQKAYQLCLDISGITAAFPNEEKFAMTSQLRRAAVSIPSNIAEVERMLKGLMNSLEAKPLSP